MPARGTPSSLRQRSTINATTGDIIVGVTEDTTGAGIGLSTGCVSPCLLSDRPARSVFAARKSVSHHHEQARYAKKPDLRIFGHGCFVRRAFIRDSCRRGTNNGG